MTRFKSTLAALGLMALCSAGAETPSSQDRLAVPAPPGPYQSSQPYLLPEGGREEGGAYGYYGAMQFPLPGRHRPYSGPGRYWAPSDWQQEGNRQRFATQPMPPWGEPRGELRRDGDPTRTRGGGRPQPRVGSGALQGDSHQGLDDRNRQ